MKLLARGVVLCALLVLASAAPAAAAPTITEFPITQQGTDPLGIASLSSTAAVFAEGSTSDFGAGNASGTTDQYSGMSGPAAAVVVSDGYLWLTEPSAGRIARVNGFTFGAMSAPLTQYPVPSGGQPEGITAGPDGNVWFTVSSNPAAIGEITPAGVITEYSSGLTANSDPTGITAGPDGNLWFTQAANPGRIGEITPAGVITEYSTGLTANSDPTGITAGPGRDLWFTEAANPGAIGWITPAGVISQVSTPTADSVPAAITEAAGDQLWFTEDGDHGFGEVTLPPPVTATEPAFGVSATSAILAGTVTAGGFPATYHFEWGATSAYGNSLPSAEASAGSGTTQTTVTQALTGLTPDTTYHYRIVSTNCAGCQAGTADGPDMTFTTTTQPSPTPPSVTPTVGAPRRPPSRRHRSPRR